MSPVVPVTTATCAVRESMGSRGGGFVWTRGGGLWTGYLRPQESSAIRKTPGVFKIMHPGSSWGGGGSAYLPLPSL